MVEAAFAQVARCVMPAILHIPHTFYKSVQEIGKGGSVRFRSQQKKINEKEKKRSPYLAGERFCGLAKTDSGRNIVESESVGLILFVPDMGCVRHMQQHQRYVQIQNVEDEGQCPLQQGNTPSRVGSFRNRVHLCCGVMFSVSLCFFTGKLLLRKKEETYPCKARTLRKEIVHSALIFRRLGRRTPQFGRPSHGY